MAGRRVAQASGADFGDLDEVVAAWPSLPAEQRAKVLAIVRSIT